MYRKEFKDYLYYQYLSGLVAACWFITQEIAAELVAMT